MGVVRTIDEGLKQEILKAVKSGMSQMEASRVFGVSNKTISTWCKQEVLGGEKNYLTEISQLRRELDNAYRVIGKLAARADRPKGS